MIKGNFTQKEKEFISKAANIELQYLQFMAGDRDEIHQISELLKNPKTTKELFPDTKLEIAVTITDMIQLFERLEKEPEILFSLALEQIDIIALILAEHFEDIWGEEDDIEFAALCHKVIRITEMLENNPINPN
jgi:hypothetical protein